MDKQDTLRNLLLAAGVFMLIMAIAPALLPAPSKTHPVDTTAGAGSVNEDGAPRPAGSTPTVGAAEPAGESAVQDKADEWSVDEAQSETTSRLGAATDSLDDPSTSPYRMILVLSNQGASVERARLSDHAARLHTAERYELLAPVDRPDGTFARSLTVEKVNVDGTDVALDDALWHGGSVETTNEADGKGKGKGEAGLDQATMSIKYWIELRHLDKPTLRLTRVFTLPAQPSGAHRHDLRIDLTIENLSTDPHEVVVTYRGGLGIPQANPRMDDRAVDYGVVLEGERVTGTRKRASVVARGGSSSVSLYRSTGDDAGRFAWVATGNTYFTCTIAPLDDQGHDNPNYVAAVSAIDIDPDNGETSDVTTRIVTARKRLAPGSRASYPAEVYLGEKDPGGFRTIPDYVERNYYFQIEAGFGWCTFGFLVRLMISVLNGLYFVVHDYGVAIIILVLIVRLLLHPITKKGQVNMVRMQQKMGEFTPKLEELKRKYGNDKARLQQETMKLYRENNINPAGNVLGCLPMFLQMPIWMALYLSLSSNIRMRHQPFLFTWIHDLTAADALIPFSTPITIPVVGWHLTSFNLLPLLVSLFMYLQQKSQPKPKPNPNMSEQQRGQQEMMQKMMPMMSIMMLLFFYKMPSGLNLYIMFSSLFGWIEQKRIRAHIKEQEEAGTLFKKPAKPVTEPVRKRPGDMTFFEKLQKMAEDAQKAQAKRATPKKGKR